MVMHLLLEIFILTLLRMRCAYMMEPTGLRQPSWQRESYSVEYTATSGQTTFSGSDDNMDNDYSINNHQVRRIVVVLDPQELLQSMALALLLDSGATVGDQVNIYAFKSFTTADMVSKTTGGTFSGAVGFGGGINAAMYS